VFDGEYECDFLSSEKIAEHLELQFLKLTFFDWVGGNLGYQR
jgi:hypothetical protein